MLMNGNGHTYVSGSVPFLGVELDGDSAITSVPEIQPIIVKRVIVGSPAAKAGLQAGDVIHSIGRTQLANRNALMGMIASQRPGKTIAIKIMRNNRQYRIKITLGERQLPALRFRPIDQHS
jgi:S1-C subfamily serine protease